MADYNILYDHYKDTFEQQRQAMSHRNRLFVITCILIAILTFFAIKPLEITAATQIFLQQSYNINIKIDIYVIQSLTWILLLHESTQYYMKCVSIEKIYDYISKIEDELANQDKLSITRESKTYLSNYPQVLNIIDFFYKWIFPIGLCVITTFKIISEICNYNNLFGLLIDGIICICFLTITIAYMLFLHGKSK